MIEETRPVGVSILAVLHIVGGGLGGIATVFLVAQLGSNPKVRQGLAVVGVPPALLIVGIAFLLVLGIASGIGMWQGLTWGWYLGSFYYMYSVVRNANALITISRLMNTLPPEEIANMSRGPSFFYMKHGLRVVVHSLLFLYFFKSNVRAFFAVAEQDRWKVTLAEFGICVGIAGAVSLMAKALG